jgi:hypothetical protein
VYEELGLSQTSSAWPSREANWAQSSRSRSDKSPNTAGSASRSRGRSLQQHSLISVFGAESDVSIHPIGNSGLHRSNAVRCGGCSCLEYPKIVDLPIAETPETTPAGTGRDLLFPGERRRPDRIEHVNPELIPLLRSDKIAKAGTHDNEQDPLRAARGVAVRGRRRFAPGRADLDWNWWASLVVLVTAEFP